MLSPQIRQKVFSLWTMFWSSGMTNPLTAIEQITYLLFLKRLEILDQQRIQEGKASLYSPRPNCNLPHHPDDRQGADNACNGHPTCKWSYIRQNPSHEHISQYVFPWLRILDQTLEMFGNGDRKTIEPAQKDMMEDAYFQFPRDKEETLQRAVKTIDELFMYVDSRAANSDILGDIFEYLLSEIESSGKNGQFRTPRHIIRFMVELLNPQPGELVIDPAAGTGGFLFSSIQHILKQATNPDVLVLEWDGTPHRLTGGDAKIEPYLTGEFFTGYDNDRTMVRIGWMNMILHGIEQPEFSRRDSLGKSLPDDESGKYNVVLANPPFTGTVDTGDLHPRRFPRNPSRSTEAITNKSELLFVWLMLDLLQVGGRCAVIVPDGVLFGSTNAHIALRRQLLFEHDLKAVISLPAGVFQPYAGVKTSILVFHKVGEQPAPGAPPRTQEVWFYDIRADGLTLDAKRAPQPKEHNDLWDALAKYPRRETEVQNYYQPTIFPARWRMVDEETLRILPELESEQGRSWSIDELFPDLPTDPTQADAFVQKSEKPEIEELYRYALTSVIQNAEVTTRRTNPEDRAQTARKIFLKTRDIVNRSFISQSRELLDNFEQHGKKTLNSLLDSLKKEIESSVESLVGKVITNVEQDASTGLPVELLWNDQKVKETVTSLVKAFAKLDGYDIYLRSREVKTVLPENHPYATFIGTEGEEALADGPRYTYEQTCWVAPVRAYAVDDEWKSKDGAIHGSHDENGQVRPEYIEDYKLKTAFNDDGSINDEYIDLLLDPDCIEANEFNLSANRYKPFTFETQKYDPPAQILRAVQALERELLSSIEKLLEMVEKAE
jgi:type I restriction enzyme M protein